MLSLMSDTGWLPLNWNVSGDSSAMFCGRTGGEVSTNGDSDFSLDECLPFRSFLLSAVIEYRFRPHPAEAHVARDLEHSPSELLSHILP